MPATGDLACALWFQQHYISQFFRTPCICKYFKFGNCLSEPILNRFSPLDEGYQWVDPFHRALCVKSEELPGVFSGRQPEQIQ